MLLRCVLVSVSIAVLIVSYSVAVPGDPCTSSNTTNCTDSSVCVINTCKLDLGGDCSSTNSANCKTGLVCDATGNTCKLDLNGDCTSPNNTYCKTGLTCDANACKLASGTTCSMYNTSCATGLTCEADVCTQSGASGIAGSGVTTTLLLFVLMIVTSHFV